MNLLDPNCGLDPEERREILLHTDAGRAVIAAEDAEMSRAVLFANGLPPGWSVGAYVKGPKKGSPCLIKGVRGQPGGVQVKPIPEGYEPDQQGGLRKKGGEQPTGQQSATAGVTATPSEPPHPLAALPTRSDKFNRLVEMASQEQEHLRGSHNRFTDPLGVFTKGSPPGLNAGEFLDDLIGTAARHHFNTSTEAPLQDLYDTVGRKHGLSKHAFLRAVGDIYNRHGRGRSPFFLDRYSGSMYHLENEGADPELVMITPTGGINNSLRLDQSEVPGEMRRQGLRGDQTLETPHSRLLGGLFGQRLAESGRPVPPEQPPVAQRPTPPPAPPTSSAAPARANPASSAGRVSSRVEVARAEIGRLNASALSAYTTPGRVEAVVRGYASYLTRAEMDQVAAHIGVVRKLPNKEAVVKAIIDRIVSQKGAYARGLE